MPAQLSSTAYPVSAGPDQKDARDQLEHYGHPSVTERLLEYCSMDVVFVSVDFENSRVLCGNPSSENTTKNGNIRSYCGAQAGISILDTRDLTKSPEIAIRTRQFCVGGYWYCDTVPWRLLFGISERHTLESLYTTLTNLLRFEDSITKEVRPIVVIGHQLQPNTNYGDIGCLHKLTDPSIRSPIIDYLDTTQDRFVYPQVASNSGTSKFQSPPLMDILKHLGIEFANLHVAANDAMFTLRAILAMTVQDYHTRSQSLSSAERKILAQLEGIARVPLSPPPGMITNPIAFPNKGGLVVKAKRNQFAVRTKERRQERQERKKTDLENTTETYDDWADMGNFTPFWDIEKEQDLAEGGHLPNAESDQTPTTTDDESLELHNEFSDVEESLELSNEFDDDSSDDTEGAE